MTIKMSHKYKKPSKVVVSGEIKKRHRSFNVKPPHIHISRRIFIVGLIVLAIATAAAATYIVYNNMRTKTVKQTSVSAQCSELYLNGYYKATDKGLEVDKKRDLKPVVTKVQAISGYEKDPNCLITVVEYYIGITDAKNTKLYYDKLSTTYDAKGYSASLKPIAQSPAQLKPIVEFLNSQVEQSKKNMMYGPSA